MKKWIERIKNLSGSTKLFLIGIALLICGAAGLYLAINQMIQLHEQGFFAEAGTVSLPRRNERRLDVVRSYYHRYQCCLVRFWNIQYSLRSNDRSKESKIITDSVSEGDE